LTNNLNIIMFMPVSLVKLV